MPTSAQAEGPPLPHFEARVTGAVMIPCREVSLSPHYLIVSVQSFKTPQTAGSSAIGAVISAVYSLGIAVHVGQSPLASEPLRGGLVGSR